MGIEVVEPCELRDRGVVPPRKRGERLAGADDVYLDRAVLVMRLGDDDDLPRERHGLAPHDCAERVRSDDAVMAEVEPVL